jgi:DNA polymerase I-like protein with 3'-5' exonuclease and polymerase domains
MDLKTAEMYIAAVVSDDIELQDIFRSGGNFHSQIAKKVFKLDCPVEDVAELHADLRQAAKAISFGILYGASAGKIAATVTAEGGKMSTRQAQATINEYFATFWKLKEWIDETRDFIKTKAHVYSPFGRKRRLPNVKSDNSGVQGHEIRSGLNFIIQSTASDVNLLGAIEMQAHIEKTGSKAKIFALVHDSILAEVPNEEIEQYKLDLVGFIQKDRGVSIPGVPIGCDFEVVADDYSNNKFTKQFGDDFDKWCKEAA